MTTPQDWLQEHPDYIEDLKSIIEYERNNPKPNSAFLEEEEYDTCWDNTELPIHSARLYQLEVNGFLDRVFDSNSTTAYSMKNRDQTAKLLTQIDSIESDGVNTVLHDFPSEEELPDDLFNDVIGYEDAKWLIRRGITADKITNFLLVGPPGSAKTVFLMCITDLGGAEFIPAMDASGAGFLDVMFDEQPQYVLFDELDDMPAGAQKTLSSYTETGIVKEVKYNKTRRMQTNTKTLASANDLSGVLDHIEDRFTVLEFDSYTLDEYIEICEHILPEREGAGPQESRQIAKLLWEQNKEGDVRDAIAVARLSRGDPERVIDALDEYSGNGLRSLS